MSARYWKAFRSVLEKAGHSSLPDDPDRVHYRHESDGSVVITLTGDAWASPVVVRVDDALYQRAWQAAARSGRK
ncbi:MAG TPA: hypothetical protein VLY46_15330 [Usitatibacter sp.]|nr:hypothetical protein [Usitatibacter sp.]